MYRFHHSTPGIVSFKETARDHEEQFSFLKPGIQISAVPEILPQPIPPPGLDQARQEYLYRHIREFVEDPWKDVLCPLPSTEVTESGEPAAAAGTSAGTPEPAADEPTPGTSGLSGVQLDFSSRGRQRKPTEKAAAAASSRKLSGRGKKSGQ